ncbi:MAG: WbqC family protein, partial [Burkholderiales bacterium]
MIIAIHQPHFLPWLGYLHRMAQVDAFVLLDHVQFERRNYQNRADILLEDEALWLTVPVVKV